MNKTLTRFGRLAAAVLLAAFLFGIGGCGRTAAVQPPADQSFEDWRVKAEQSRGFSPPTALPATMPAEEGLVDPVAAAPVAQAPEPVQQSLTGSFEAADLPRQHISLKVKDADVATLLRALARAAGQNILITQNVTGKTTINVQDLPWNQVFESILRTHGLTFQREGDLLRVQALADLDQEIKLMEAIQKKTAKAREFRLEMDSLRAREQMVEPLQTWVYHVRYADTNTLRDNLEKFLRSARFGADVTVSDKDQGKVAGNIRGAILVDPHTNSLVVQAVQSDIARIQEAVRMLDIPTRQVLIEAYIVQGTDSAVRELGSQWGGGYKTGEGSSNHYITSGANSTGGIGNSLDNANTTGDIVNFPATGVTSAAGFTLGYLAQDVGRYLLSVQLSALESQGKLDILSSPSITTLDNRKAIIESGKEIPFQTTDDGNVNIQYKKAVLSLEVTPYVVDASTLKLAINTRKDEPDFGNTVGGQPTIITRRAETSVVLFDGQTTVIGGLSEKKRTRSEDGVPALMQVPLLGRLFRRDMKENSFDELLIFITPHILQEGSATAGEGRN